MHPSNGKGAVTAAHLTDVKSNLGGGDDSRGSLLRPLFVRLCLLGYPK